MDDSAGERSACRASSDGCAYSALFRRCARFDGVAYAYPPGSFWHMANPFAWLWELASNYHAAAAIYSRLSIVQKSRQMPERTNTLLVWL